MSSSTHVELETAYMHPMEGTDRSLLCIIGNNEWSSQHSGINWYKDDVQLLAEEGDQSNDKKYEDLGTTRLTIHNLTEHDSGKYKCASGAGGTEEQQQHFSLDVRCKLHTKSVKLHRE